MCLSLLLALAPAMMAQETTGAPAGGSGGLTRLIPASYFEKYSSRVARAPGNFVVDTTADGEDATPGDGICADANGDCTLRAAINEANALDPGSIIEVPAGTYVLTVVEDANFQTALVLGNTMTLLGAGAASTIIDGNQTGAVLLITNTENALVQGFTFTNGSGVVASAITIVGALYNAGSGTRFNNIVVSDSTAMVAGGYASEGGSSGVISNSAFINNTGTGLPDTSNPQDFSGGGILVAGAALTLENVTISGNSAPEGAGMQLIESTVNVNNVTIGANTAANVGGGIHQYTDTALTDPSVVNLSNSIIALNTAPTGPNCNMTINSAGDNLIGDDTGCTVSQNDLVDTDPLVDALAFSPFGSTFVHALQEGSPAIDAGTDATCKSTDQRGISRPQRAACDIGAYEKESIPTPTPTPEATSTPDITPTPTGEAGVNLLVNGGFEAKDSNNLPDLTPWTSSNASGDKIVCNKDTDGDGTIDKVVAFEGTCAYQFKGSASENSKIQQTIDLTLNPIDAGDTLTLGGFYTAKGAVNAKVKVTVKYTDTTLAKGKITVSLANEAADYTAFTGTLDVLIAGAPQSVKVQLQNKGTSGKVVFDSLRLSLTEGSAAALPLP